MLSLAQNRMSTFLLVLVFLFTTAVAAVAQGTAVAPAQGTAVAPAPVTVKYNLVDNAELVYVPEGVITRKSEKANIGGIHTVTGYEKVKYEKYPASVDGFWIYKNLVTVAQYRYFCQMTHRDMPEEPYWKWQENHPIVNVTWNDAADYAKWASAVLPTVAQWQLAGYGTDGRKFPWGNQERKGKRIILTSTKPIGSTPVEASPCGAQDMVGNVDQWCADWYGENYYSIAPAKNPTGPAIGTLREIRGGSWVNEGYYESMATHYAKADPLLPDPTIGFRCIYPGIPADEPTKELPKPDGQVRINLVRTDGLNLKITKSDEYAVTAQLDSVDCNDWWAGNFTSLPTDKPATITIPTTTRSEKRPVVMKNWQGLVPVMTYADPNKYESYECYSKDDTGRWVSDDLFKKGDERYAGNDKLPIQNVMPEKLAAQFLSKDGKRWEPWREVDKAEVSADNSTFVVTQQFDAANASVAMRVPYTYTYEEELLKRLAAAKIPGLTIDTICESTVDKLIAPQTYWKRKFKIIRIESPAVNAEDKTKRPGILVYAREHATEQDSSWALHGMLRWLLSDDEKAVKARTQNNWLLFPLYDPDAAANSSWRDGLDCISDNTVWSNYTYEKMWYFVDWITKGHRLDLAIDLHGSECAEAENLTAPYIISSYVPRTDARLKTEIAYNTALFKQAADAGYQVGKPEARKTLLEPVRMVYWTNVLSRTLGQSLEVNSRYPQNRLTQTQMYDLGRQIATSSIAFINSPDFELSLIHI